MVDRQNTRNTTVLHDEGVHPVMGGHLANPGPQIINGLKWTTVPRVDLLLTTLGRRGRIRKSKSVIHLAVSRFLLDTDVFD